MSLSFGGSNPPTRTNQKQQEMRKVSSKIVPLSYNDCGSARVLVIIQRAIPSDYSFSHLREALEDITNEWNNTHYMSREYTSHDCDGSRFTTHSKTISEAVIQGVDGLLVEAIIEHHTAVNI